MAEVREITRSARIWARSEMIASVMPSAKYSWAGSCEMLRSGSTAIARMDSLATGTGADEMFPARIRRNVSATAAAELGRWDGSLFRHYATRRSSSGGASGRSERTDGAELLMMANI